MPLTQPMSVTENNKQFFCPQNHSSFHPRVRNEDNLSIIQYSQFLNIAPGLGKTKLILAAAINLVQTTQFPVFVLNSNKTLCDRDFQEANFSLEELKIPCASVISQKSMITFSTTQDFIDSIDDLPEKYHVLLDEY